MFLYMMDEQNKKHQSNCDNCKWQKEKHTFTRMDGCGHPKRSAFGESCKLFENK